MNFDSDAQRTYPKFTKYIKFDFPKLLWDPAARPVIHGLRKWGKLSDVEIRSALRWGTHPLLKIVDMTPGPTTAIDEFPEALKLYPAMVQAYEDKETASRVTVVQSDGVTIPPQYPVWQNGRGQDFYVVGATILTMLVDAHLLKKPPRPIYGQYSSARWDALRGFYREVYGIIMGDAPTPP